MKTLSGERLCSVLERHGWERKRIRGADHIYACPSDATILTVPVHGNKDLKKGTLRQLLKDAGLTEHDL